MAAHSPKITIQPSQVCTTLSMAFEYALMTAACPAGALVQLPVRGAAAGGGAGGHAHGHAAGAGRPAQAAQQEARPPARAPRAPAAAVAQAALGGSCLCRLCLSEEAWGRPAGLLPCPSRPAECTAAILCPSSPRAPAAMLIRSVWPSLPLGQPHSFPDSCSCCDSELCLQGRASGLFF